LILIRHCSSFENAWYSDNNGKWFSFPGTTLGKQASEVSEAWEANNERQTREKDLQDGTPIEHSALARAHVASKGNHDDEARVHLTELGETEIGPFGFDRVCKLACQ